MIVWHAQYKPGGIWNVIDDFLRSPGNADSSRSTQSGVKACAEYSKTPNNPLTMVSHRTTLHQENLYSRFRRPV
jgi:hypothetical protein